MGKNIYLKIVFTTQFEKTTVVSTFQNVYQTCVLTFAVHIFKPQSFTYGLVIIVSRQNLLWRFMCSFCHKKSDAQQKTYEAEKCYLQINQ